MWETAGQNIFEILNVTTSAEVNLYIGVISKFAEVHLKKKKEKFSTSQEF